MLATIVNHLPHLTPSQAADVSCVIGEMWMDVDLHRLCAVHFF